MNNLWPTLAALFACGALVTGLFAVACVTHLRSAKRAPALAFFAFALAALAVFADRGGQLPLRGIAIFLAAAVAGALLGSRVPLAARIHQVAWVPSFAAGAVALASLEHALDGQGWSRLAAGASALLGFAALLLGLLRLKADRDTPASNVGIALVFVLAGASQLLAGLWNAQALLLVSGGVVAFAGVSLARAMARAAGRPVQELLMGGAQPADAFGYQNLRQSDPEGAAMILASSRNIVIVPGYGLALAQGQHGIKELVERLEKVGAKVRIVVHPAAGIVPGHMNALLDEAGIPHTALVESAAAAEAIKGADVLVVGANDIVNAEASREATVLAGLDAVDLKAANSVWVIKRSLRPGQGEIRNSLFELPHTTMILGDAKKVLQALVAKLNAAAH